MPGITSSAEYSPIPFRVRSFFFASSGFIVESSSIVGKPFFNVSAIALRFVALYPSLAFVFNSSVVVAAIFCGEGQ